MNAPMHTVVTVTLTDREDGGLSVSSVDLPGLILSGSEAEKVCACIEPAIEAILERKGYTVTSIHSETALSDILKLDSPRDVALKVTRFIVELKVAA